VAEPQALPLPSKFSKSTSWSEVVFGSCAPILKLTDSSPMPVSQRSSWKQLIDV